MNPKLQHIRIFVAVYEEQSFTAAAARENISQSGISQYIRQLEDQLGVQLFNRQYTLVPTPASHVYYGRCIELLRAHATANLPLNPDAKALTGTLHVGLIQAVTRSALSSTLMAFKDSHPQVLVHVIEAHSAVILAGVRRGQLEFGLVPRVANHLRGLRASTLTKSPAFLVSSPNCPTLRHCEPVQLKDVADLRLIVGTTGSARLLLERYMLDLGIHPVARLETMESVQGALSLVRSSHWKMIWPGIFIADELRRHRYTLNPLVGPPLWEELVLIEPERQPLSAAAQAFLDVLRAEIAAINDIPTRIVLGEMPPSIGLADPAPADERALP